MNKYFKRNTLKSVSGKYHRFPQNIEVVPWSLHNILEEAKSAHFSLLPLRANVPIQYYKPENRLLIMWRLGLPCLTSSIPSYERISQHIGQNFLCSSEAEWTQKLTDFISNNEIAYQQVQLGQAYLKSHHNQDILISKWDGAAQSIL
jgi:hypothetical protein